MWGCARNRCRCAGAGREWSEDSRAVGCRQSGARWHRSSSSVLVPRHLAGYAGGPAPAGGIIGSRHTASTPFYASRGAQALGSTWSNEIGRSAVFGSTRPPASNQIAAERRRVRRRRTAGTGHGRLRYCRICSTAPNRLGEPRALSGTCALDRGKLGCAANEVRAVVKHDPAFAAPIPVVPAFDPARLSRRSRRNEQVGA